MKGEHYCYGGGLLAHARLGFRGVGKLDTQESRCKKRASGLGLRVRRVNLCSLFVHTS